MHASTEKLNQFSSFFENICTPPSTILYIITEFFFLIDLSRTEDKQIIKESLARDFVDVNDAGALLFTGINDTGDKLSPVSLLPAKITRQTPFTSIKVKSYILLCLIQ